MPDKTDEEIATEVQKGNIEIFGTLVSRYEQKMTRYGRRFLFDREDVKDLVQEVFIKAYVNIQSFDAQKKFSPWIYRIAHNEFINAIKKKTKIPVLAFDPDLIFPHPVAKETADSEMRRRELRGMLDKFMGKIDGKYRETLILYYFEKLDYKEISEILEIPVSTVGVRLNRGKAMLKEMVEKISEPNS